MSLLKKVLLGFFIVFIAIQFFQPARNQSEQVLAGDITRVVMVPANVLGILQNACNDCHSNNTLYPWYVKVQPIGWMMARHIKNGKDDLNFSEFGTYSSRRQTNKLKSIASQVQEGSMPISSYAIMHKNARLSQAQKRLIIEWASKTRDALIEKK